MQAVDSWCGTYTSSFHQAIILKICSCGLEESVSPSKWFPDSSTCFDLIWFTLLLIRRLLERGDKTSIRRDGGEEEERVNGDKMKERRKRRTGRGNYFTCFSKKFPIYLYIYPFVWVCVWVYLSVCPVLPIAVDYPGDTEQSLQQPSAVNEQMESTAFPLNSLSLYWTWQRRLIIGLSHRYFWWLIPVLIKKRRRGDGVCWRGWLKCPHQQQRPTRSQWMVSEERESLQPNLIKTADCVLLDFCHTYSLFLLMLLESWSSCRDRLILSNL